MSTIEIEQVKDELRPSDPKEKKAPAYKNAYEYVKHKFTGNPKNEKLQIKQLKALKRIDLNKASVSDVKAILRDTKDQKKAEFDKYKNFKGMKFESNPQELDRAEAMVKDFLNFDYTKNSDWQFAALNQHWVITYFSLILGVEIKVQHVKRTINGKEFVAFTRFLKNPIDRVKKVGYKNLMDRVVRNIPQLTLKNVYPTYLNIEDFKNDDKSKEKYQIFLPAFNITKDVDVVLRDRVSTELQQMFRNDPKYLIFTQYISYSNYVDLITPKYWSNYFNVCGYEPFILARGQGIKMSDPSLKNSCAGIWMTSMLNLTQIESTFHDLLVKFGLTDFMHEFIKVMFSDNPNVSLSRYGKLSNGIMNLMMCKSDSVRIPSFDLNGHVMTETMSFVDNLFDYEQLISDLKVLADELELPTFKKMIDISTTCVNKDHISIVVFAVSLGNISGFTGGDIFESVYRQIYLANDVINEYHDINPDEARAQAEKDWENKSIPQEYIDNFKNEYFERGFDIRGYVPENFEYGNTLHFKEYKDSLKVGLDIINSNVIVDNFNDMPRLRKKIYSYQTSNGASEYVKLRIPTPKPDYIDKIKKESVNVYKISNFNATESVSIANKRGMAIFVGTDYLLSTEIASIKSIVSGGYRWVTGPKPPRQIFNDGMSQYSLHNAIRSIFNDLKKTTNFGKTKGLAIYDNYFLIAASSLPELISIYNDFTLFDGSCKSGIQKPIYDYFQEAFKAMFDLTKDQTFGDLLNLLQKPKYRQPLLVKVKNKIEIHFIDMIFSGELLTNLKDSIINFALTHMAVLRLMNLISGIASYNIEDLRVNGDDSHFIVRLFQTAYTIKKVGNKLFVKYNKAMLKAFTVWKDSLSDVYKSLGFTFKSDYSSRFCEYLKVRVCNGMFIPNLRLQFYVSEKTSLLRRRYLYATFKSISGTAVERGMSSTNTWRQLIMLCSNGEKLSVGEFFVMNVVTLFSTARDGGVTLPIHHNLTVLPNTSLYSSYLMLRSSQGEVNNNMISRFINMCYKEEPEGKLTRQMAAVILSGDADVTGSSLPDDLITIHARDFLATRDQIRTRDSVSAFHKLKSKGVRISKGSAYFNGLENYLASSLGKNLANSKFFNMNERIHFKTLYYLENYSGKVRDLNQTEMILLGMNLSTNSENELDIVDYSTSLNNVAIGSNLIVSFLKHRFGYATLQSSGIFDNDLITEIRNIDQGLPHELSNEVLVNAIMRPEIMFDRENFELMLSTLGVKSYVANDIFDKVVENSFFYANSIRKENFSSISQMLTLWDLSPNNLLKSFKNIDYMETKQIDNIITGIALPMYLVNALVDEKANIVVASDIKGSVDTNYIAEVMRGILMTK